MLGNPLILALAGIIPMIVGAIYYGPLFGNAWMKANGFTKEKMEEGNMPLILGLSFILSVILAIGISALTNHQNGVLQLFAMHPDFGTAGTEVGDLYTAVMDKFGNTHRSFGHGALHGFISAVLIAFPLIAINALFERRGWKYIGIHVGYWAITLTLMGGVICQWM